MSQSLEELVASTIKDVKDNKEVAYDVGSLALMNRERSNAEAVATYLLDIGLYEEYGSILRHCKLLSLEKEFEKVKKNDNPSAYVAIEKLLSGEDFEYAKNQIIQRGSVLDKVKLVINDKRVNIVEVMRTVKFEENSRALSYLVKYMNFFDYDKCKKDAYVDNLITLIEVKGDESIKRALAEKRKESSNFNNILNGGKNYMARC